MYWIPSQRPYFLFQNSGTLLMMKHSFRSSSKLCVSMAVCLVPQGLSLWCPAVKWRYDTAAFEPHIRASHTHTQVQALTQALCTESHRSRQPWVISFYIDDTRPIPSSDPHFQTFSLSYWHGCIFLFRYYSDNVGVVFCLLTISSDAVRIRIRISFIGQVCEHIQGIWLCFFLQCNCTHRNVFIHMTDA